MNKLEKRFTTIVISEPETDTEQRYVEGLGIVYDKEEELWDGYFESIAAGAFTESLKDGHEIKSCYNHNDNFILSTTKSNPKLELTDTEKGLKFKSPIPPTTYGKDLIINLERGNIHGASFTFTVPEDGDEVTRDWKGHYHRKITKAVIYEIGPVLNPAYESTSVKLRSRNDLINDAKNRCKPETETRKINSNKIKLLQIMEVVNE